MEIVTKGEKAKSILFCGYNQSEVGPGSNLQKMKVGHGPARKASGVFSRKPRRNDKSKYFELGNGKRNRRGSRWSLRIEKGLETRGRTWKRKLPLQDHERKIRKGKLEKFDQFAQKLVVG